MLKLCEVHLARVVYACLWSFSLLYFICPLVPSWALRGERAFCLRQVWRPGWVRCCGSSVFLSHPRSRSSLVFPLPCTLTSWCCKLYWQADEVPCMSGTQTIWFSAVGCGRELVLFQPFLWSWLEQHQDQRNGWNNTKRIRLFCGYYYVLLLTVCEGLFCLLLNLSATCLCILGTDLLRQFYVPTLR